MAMWMKVYPDPPHPPPAPTLHALAPHPSGPGPPTLRAPGPPPFGPRAPPPFGPPGNPHPSEPPGKGGLKEGRSESLKGEGFKGEGRGERKGKKRQREGYPSGDPNPPPPGRPPLGDPHKNPPLPGTPLKLHGGRVKG